MIHTMPAVHNERAEHMGSTLTPMGNLFRLEWETYSVDRRVRQMNPHERNLK